MEFVAFADAWPELEDGGVVPRDESVPLPPPPPGVLAALDLALADAAESIDLAAADGSSISLPLERRADAVEQVLHKLRLPTVVVMPRTRWRHVLDAVTFSLAEHRGWQEIEAESALILNTRDALVCGPADLKTVRALVEAVFRDGRGPDETIFVLPPSGRLLLSATPGGAVRIEVTSPAMATSVRDLLASFA